MRPRVTKGATSTTRRNGKQGEEEEENQEGVRLGSLAIVSKRVGDLEHIAERFKDSYNGNAMLEE